jgi:predicted dehydrogenase
MTLKIAFAGFRHGHILGLYNKAKESAALEIVAACEEDAATRSKLSVEAAWDNYDKMLAEVPCDIIAVGDYYAKRGSMLIKALKAGKHVIADKPICTSLEELAEIEKLAKANNLKVGCQLDLRTSVNITGARNLIRTGALGNIQAIQFGGQHPLMYGTRPGWYFEEGKHGGTINDIAIHGIDVIPWMTGLKFTEITAARAWNAFATECPHFNDAGQFMLKMNNGCGVFGDVSYFAPDSCGYSLPYYWRFTIWGTKGVAEFNYSDPGIKFAALGTVGISHLAQPSSLGPDYLTDFLADIAGKPGDLDTATVIESSRNTLKVQEIADRGCCASSF